MVWPTAQCLGLEIICQPIFSVIFIGRLLSLNVNCYGVLQGSILGPFLFIIYPNDLPQVLMNSKMSFYADDTMVYESDDTNETKLFQQDIKCVTV